MLRGFDAEHGQDIRLTVDGIPINLPSHIRQGYADIGSCCRDGARAPRDQGRLIRAGATSRSRAASTFDWASPSAIEG
jgi:hypothetical protein